MGLHKRLGQRYSFCCLPAQILCHVWYDLFKPRATNISFNICHCFHCQTFTFDCTKFEGARARRWSSSLDKSIFAILSPATRFGQPGAHAKGRGAVVCPKLVKFVLCYMRMGLDMYRCIHNMHSMYVYIHIIESTTIYHLSSSRTRNFPPKSPSLPNAEVGEVKRLSGRSLEDWVLQPWHLIQTQKNQDPNQPTQKCEAKMICWVEMS